MKWANSQEAVYVGWIGTILFAILTLISLVGCYHSPNVLLTRLFFLSTLLSTSLDLPRYIFLIVDEEYISTIGYSCHILSNYFFFLSLTLVCVVWAHLLQYSSSHSSSSFIYRGQGVITTNVILAIISLITFAFAIKSNSLENFLSSSIYYVYIFIEVLEDLFYSIVVAFFGMKLVLRFQNYASGGNSKNKIQTTAFRKALKKVALTLCLNAICSTLRILLLLFFIFHNAVGHISTPIFRQYGVLWFLWSDFIPKGVATLAFLYLMASRTQHKQGSPAMKPSWASNLNELELERSKNYDWNGEDRESGTRGSEIVVNPVTDFDVSPDLSYPAGRVFSDDYPEDSISIDENDRQTHASSASFWDSPTAAQDALNKITKRPAAD